MAYEYVLYEKKGKITYITLNRPQILNAINDAMHVEVLDAFREFDRDDESWIAILSGKGRVFCSGADVRQRQLRPREELIKLGGPGGAVMRGGGGMLGQQQTVNWKPIIGAVHGYAVGMGVGFATACDLVVAADDAKFQWTEIGRGLGTPGILTHALAYGGGKLAAEIALTSRFFSAQEALQIGMVSKVVPKDQLMAAAEQLAEQVNSNPPLSIRSCVRMERWFDHKTTEEAGLYGSALKLHLSEDFHEGALAFMEKRKPNFKGK